MLKIKYFKIIISYILSLALITTLVLYTLTMFLKNILLNHNFYVNLFEENKIYEKIHMDLNKDLITIAKRNNIHNSLINNIVNEEEIREEVNKLVNDTIEYAKDKNNKIHFIDLQIFKKKFDSNIIKYLNENNIKISNFNNFERSEYIKASNEIINSIKNNLNIIDEDTLGKCEKIISKYCGVFKSITLKVYLSIMVYPLICLIFITWLWIRYPKKILRFVGYSFVVSSVIVLIISLVKSVLIIQYGNLIINDFNLSEIVQVNYFKYIYKYSLIFSIVGSITISSSNLFKN